MVNKTQKTAPTKLSAVPKTAKPSPTRAAAPKISIVSGDTMGPELPQNDPLIADLPEGNDKADALKLKELLDAVTAKTSVKRKDAKEVIEAAMSEIAAALTRGHGVQLQSLGNLRVAKTMEKGDAKMMVLRLRIGGGKDAKEDLAEDGEDS